MGQGNDLVCLWALQIRWCEFVVREHINVGEHHVTQGVAIGLAEMGVPGVFQCTQIEFLFTGSAVAFLSGPLLVVGVGGARPVDTYREGTLGTSITTRCRHEVQVATNTRGECRTVVLGVVNQPVQQCANCYRRRLCPKRRLPPRHIRRPVPWYLRLCRHHKDPLPRRREQFVEIGLEGTKLVCAYPFSTHNRVTEPNDDTSDARHVRESHPIARDKCEWSS